MSDVDVATDDALRERMARPQRHRLLQGYPALPLMRLVGPTGHGPFRGGPILSVDGSSRDRREDGARTAPHLTLDASRPLLVGVIAHTQCNPKVEGCGFCTFPHDTAEKHTRRRMVDSTVDDVATILDHERLRGRKVHALYFGGGTANLASGEQLHAVFDAIAARVDVSGAEVTLEGVPSLFLSLLGGPLKMLAGLPVRTRRVSMGVQTFDDAQLGAMGRRHFGDETTVRKVVKRAHGLGMTASGDFLVNLPGQTRAAMLDDVRRAVDTGLDQICIYHLVLYAGLGTAWSNDPAKLAALPAQDEAVENWLAVRQALVDAGFLQTTLTNFEKPDVHASERRFAYEEASFTPEAFDGVGVGALSVSTFVNLAEKRGIKLMRGKTVIAPPWSGTDMWFAYDEEDLKCLFFTRSLPRLAVDRGMWRRVFGRDLTEDFGGALHAAVRAELATLDDESFRLTPRGMFFADAVVGLATSARAAVVREHAAGRHTHEVLQERVFASFMG